MANLTLGSLRTYLEIAASVAEQGLSATNLPDLAEKYAMSRGSLPESDLYPYFRIGSKSPSERGSSRDLSISAMRDTPCRREGNVCDIVT